jgi:hypothetical protein
MQLHHTGSQEKSLVTVPEEQTGADPQELQAQEVPEKEEQGERQAQLHSKFPTLFKQFFIYELYILLH